jgi:hypothetical protein
MRGKGKVVQQITELGKKVKSAKASVTSELKSIGGTVAQKTTGVRSSLRRLTKRVKRGS